MDQKFSEAKEVFDKANDIGFQFEELTRLQFFPHVLGDRATRVRLEGTVVSVKAGYPLRIGTGVPRLLLLWNKIRSTSTDAWMKVTFEPAFCARGPLWLMRQEWPDTFGNEGCTTHSARLEYCAHLLLRLAPVLLADSAKEREPRASTTDHYQSREHSQPLLTPLRQACENGAGSLRNSP
jgi:hypothetical protein